MQAEVKKSKVESITLTLEPDEFLALALTHWACFCGHDPDSTLRDRLEKGFQSAAQQAFGKGMTAISKLAPSAGNGGSVPRVQAVAKSLGVASDAT